EHQIAKQVGLILVLLEIDLVAFAEHLPIDIAQVVAGSVLAVLGKFYRESVVRTAMQTGHVAFDDMPRSQAQALNLSQRLRIDRRQGLHAAGPRWCSGEHERASDG